MTAQTLIAALLVLVCSGYAAWTLMPSAARRALATWLLGMSLPQRLTRLLTTAAAPASACSCSGCDRATSAIATRATQAVQIHRRIKS
jgi:ferrous iron transport protein B